MYIKVYETVPQKDKVLKAIHFGLETIDLKENEHIDLDKIDIRVFSLGHSTSKGTSSLIKRRVHISIFTCMCADMLDIYRTIFHELIHLKQFSTKAMVKCSGPNDPDEIEAVENAEVLLEKFLKLK